MDSLSNFGLENMSSKILNLIYLSWNKFNQNKQFPFAQKSYALKIMLYTIIHQIHTKKLDFNLLFQQLYFKSFSIEYSGPVLGFLILISYVVFILSCTHCIWDIVKTMMMRLYVRSYSVNITQIFTVLALRGGAVKCEVVQKMLSILQISSKLHFETLYRAKNQPQTPTTPCSIINGNHRRDAYSQSTLRRKVYGDSQRGMVGVWGWFFCPNNCAGCLKMLFRGDLEGGWHFLNNFTLDRPLNI